MLFTHKVKYLYLILSVFLSFKPAVASTEYTIENIKVQAEAENAVQARFKAIAEGEKRALLLLMEKIAPTKNIGEMTSEPISNLVKEFELSNEKMSATEYHADMTVTFDQQAVESWLMIAKNPQPLSQTQHSYLVVPAYIHNQQLLLWEEHNQWLQAWNRAIESNKGEKSFVIPLGDIDDMAVFSDTAINSGNFNDLEAILNKYHVDSLVVVKSEYQPTQVPALKVSVKCLSRTQEHTIEKHFTATKDQSIEQLLQHAASELMNSGFQDSAAVAAPKDHVIIPAKVAISSLSEWTKIKKTITSMPLVAKLNVKELTTSYAILDISYEGNQEAMKLALQNQNFVVQMDNDIMTLTY